MLLFKIALAFLFCFQALAFYDQIKPVWESGFRIKLAPNTSLNEPIEKPSGVHIKLFEIYYYQRDFSPAKQCVTYQIPQKKSPGKLFVHDLKLHDDCRKFLLQPSPISISNIYNLAIQIKEQVLTLKIDKKNYDFNLYNKPLDSHYHLGESSFLKNKLAGLKVSFVDQKLKPYPEQTVCRHFNDLCELEFDYCDSCQKPVLDFIGQKCAMKFDAFCSDLPCGGKDQRACIRGDKVVGPLDQYCFADSPRGYCKKPLRVFCDNGILVCK